MLFPKSANPNHSFFEKISRCSHAVRASFDKSGGMAYHKVKNQEGVLHPITIYNKNYYIIARNGDTWKSIGQEIGISWRKIAKYNERDKKDNVIPGERIYLKKKRSKAEKRFKKYYHVVKPGESMYSIAQLYGIKLKSLYAINSLSPNYQIYVGALLKVY